MKKIPFHYAILLGMIAGALYGHYLPDYVFIVSPLGKIFLKLLKLLVVPLIFFSIADGILRIGNAKRLSVLGGKTLLYYIATNFLAVLTSLVLVNVIRPGSGINLFGEKPDALENSVSLIDMIPGNVVESFYLGNTLQVVFLAIVAGTALLVLREKTRTLQTLVAEGNEVLLKLTHWVIALAPLGVLGLLADLMSSFDLSVLKGISKFAFTILAGLFIHGFITLPVIFKLFSNRSLKDFAKASEPALLSAFSTSSSSATLPITFDCVENRAGIPKETAGFVLPVGATVNMDGTAMYEAVACLFIAQALGIDLSIAQQITVFFMASLAAVGAASIPSAGLVTLAMVLNAVGLPLEGIGFLLAFDRPLDMSRTVVNVWGDMVGCAVVQGKEK